MSTIERISSDRLHATCVAVGGLGVLLTGRPGAGKSDLAMRLIDRGAELVADDVTIVTRRDAGLIASVPDAIAGTMEVRGLGLLTVPALAHAPVVLLVDLDGEGERLPPVDETRHVAGLALPVLRLDSRPASAPIKVEWALRRLSGPA